MNREDLKIIQYEITRDPYRHFDKVTLDRCDQEDGSVKWAIRNGDQSIFNKKIKRFEYEMLPSNRAKNHAYLYRYDTIEEALKDAPHIKWYSSPEKGISGFRYFQDVNI